jgi:hypothetical protein
MAAATYNTSAMPPLRRTAPTMAHRIWLNEDALVAPGWKSAPRLCAQLPAWMSAKKGSRLFTATYGYPCAPSETNRTGLALRRYVGHPTRGYFLFLY